MTNCQVEIWRMAMQHGEHGAYGACVAVVFFQFWHVLRVTLQVLVWTGANVKYANLLLVS
jgi:hypothetical protein